jgi:hypothetical protein
MRLLRRNVCLRMPWADRNVAEIQRFQDPADAALVQQHEEPRQDALLQIAQPPAHNAVLCRVRSFANPLAQHRFLRFGELARRTAAMRTVGQTRHAMLVISDHPIAQCLTVHPADPRRFGSTMALQNQPDGQQATRQFRIRLPRSERSQLLRTMVQPRNPYRHRRPRSWTADHESHRIEPGQAPITIRVGPVVGWYQSGTDQA